MVDSPHVPGTRIKPLAAIVIALAVVASILGIVSAGDNVLGWDVSLAKWIQNWQGSLGERLYTIGDILGTTSIAAAITVVALIIAIALKQMQISVFLVLVLLLRLAGIQLKPLFDSPRPTEEHLRLLETFDGTGYPSGHSMTVAMVSAMLVLISWRNLSDVRLKWAISAIAAIAITLVGWSRVWSGAHWPSDVLGGWGYGIALVLGAWILSDAIALKISESRDMAPRIATD